MQRDEGIGERGAGGQALGEGARVLLAGPQQLAGGRRSYNRRVTFNSGQGDGPLQLAQVRDWARELGFSQIGVAGVDLSTAEPGLLAWLDNGFHGGMEYMAAHGVRRARPAELVPGTTSVITARMDYLPATTPEGWQAIEFARLERPQEAIVSLYARGRDYHKVLRARLQKLSERIAQAIGPFGHRVFTDSAPVLEVELGARSGQGWRGRHTLVLDRAGGSMFFLGEIYVDFALPPTEPVGDHCGRCSACIDVCPTNAIVAPYRLDARKCISYLTIEHAGSIPEELRPLMGNRIYGCDDCQLVCPWNKFAGRSALPDFDAREGLVGQSLVALFGWSEEEFLRFTEGSPIRRIGHERWLRNIAVAMGNALRKGEDAGIRAALQERIQHPSVVVREHVEWALGQAGGAAVPSSPRPTGEPADS
jgi:epoxyqueuosine reductase